MQPQAAPQQPMMGGGGGLGSMLMTGAAIGVGSAVAHEAVRGIMGGGSHGHQQQGYAPDQ
jgi:hypothetical protein